MEEDGNSISTTVLNQEKKKKKKKKKIQKFILIYNINYQAILYLIQLIY